MPTITVITDRQIQAARNLAHEQGNEALYQMLEDLLRFREHARCAVAEHDFRLGCNSGVSELSFLVYRSGCQWWACDQKAVTVRMQRAHGGIIRWLCRDHADQGEREGTWNENHRDHVRWKCEDDTARKRKAG
jgi:hypothetical protein